MKIFKIPFSSALARLFLVEEGNRRAVVDYKTRDAQKSDTTWKVNANGMTEQSTTVLVWEIVLHLGKVLFNKDKS